MQSRWFNALLCGAFTLACGVCTHSPPLQTAPVPPTVVGNGPTFIVIFENEDGQVLNADGKPIAIGEVSGTLADLMSTETRPDGSVLVTAITDRNMFTFLDGLFQSISVQIDRPMPDLARLLLDGHVTCHTALTHPPRLGGSLAGPGLLDCSDLLLVGFSPLSDEPIWKQRGLILSDKEYPDRIILAKIPSTGPAMPPAGSGPATITEIAWKQLTRYLSAIPRYDTTVTPEHPHGSIGICQDINRLTDAERGNVALIAAVVETLNRFIDADPRNSKKIANASTSDGLDIDRLDEESITLLQRLATTVLTERGITLLF